MKVGYVMEKMIAVMAQMRTDAVSIKISNVWCWIKKATVKNFFGNFNAYGKSKSKVIRTAHKIKKETPGAYENGEKYK